MFEEIINGLFLFFSNFKLAQSSEHSAGFWISQINVCYDKGKCRLCSFLFHFLRWVSVIRSWMKMLNSKLKSPHAEPHLNVKPIFKYPIALLYSSPFLEMCASIFSWPASSSWGRNTRLCLLQLPLAWGTGVEPLSVSSLLRHLIPHSVCSLKLLLFVRQCLLCSPSWDPTVFEGIQ